MMASSASPQAIYIDDLDTQATDVTVSEDVITSWQLAEDSFVEATEKDNDGNQEAAYMLYKRHIYVIQKTQLSKAYLQNVDHWEQYFSKENLRTAVERSEDLAKSLKKRLGSGGITGKLKQKLKERSETQATPPLSPRKSTAEDDNGSGSSDNGSEFDSDEDETDAGLESLNEHKALVVRNLPSMVTEDSVVLYFERRRVSDGGPVEKVDLLSDGSAVVYFEDAEVAKRVLKKTNHKIKNQNVHVEVYVPEEPTIETKHTVEVRGYKSIPDDVLEMYFEDTRKSGGGHVKSIKRNEDRGVVLVTFTDIKTVEKVLKKKTHKIKNTVLVVSPYKEEVESTEVEYDPTLTVEVRDFGSFSDDVLEMYFEDTNKSGGSDVKCIERKDDVVYVIFQSEKAATRVLNREHKIKTQRLQVRPIPSSVSQQSKYVEVSNDSHKTVHVRGCREISEDLLEMYFQNKRRSGGGEIVSMQKSGDNVYITFENTEDAKTVTEKNHKIGSSTLSVSLENQSEGNSLENYGELDSDSFSSDDEDTDEMFVLQVNDLKQVSEDTLLLYFENRRRSGGGEVEAVEVDAKSESAIIYFKDGDVVPRILQKSSHLLEGKLLQVTPYIRSKPQGIRSWLRCLKKANTIEVKGCREVGNDKLEFYFDNETRSGGSDLRKVKRSEENKDVVYIVFRDVGVAKRVSSRQHSLGRYHFEVTLLKRKPKYDNRYLITEMKESTTEEKLTEYLRKYTPWRPLGFVHGGDVGCVLVTVDTSKTPLRIRDIQRICNLHPLEGAFLDISPVPISNCILVKGLETDTDAEHISLYFESLKSGNTMRVLVEKVEQPVAGEALVYFENYKVIENILPKKHRLGSASITVSLYIECLQPSPAVFHIPPNLSIGNLNTYLVKYIQESPQKDAELKEQLRNIHAELEWTSDESAEIECLLSEETPEVRTLAKSWETTVRETFQVFTNQYLVKEDKVLDDIWQKVTPALESMDRKPCKLFLLPGCKIAIVGPHSDVLYLAEEIEDIISSAENERKKENEEITETVKTTSPLIVRLLQDSKFNDVITRKNAKVKVNFSKHADHMILSGPIEDVRLAKLQTEEKARTVTVTNVGNMSRAQLELVEKDDIRQYLLKKMAQKGLFGSWMVDNGKIRVASFSDTDGHAVVQMIKQLVSEQKIDLKEESLPLLASKKWSELVAAQTESKGNLVKIMIDEESRAVFIYATDEEIVNVTEEVNNFINENTVYSDFVQYQPGVQRFLSRYEMDFIRNLSTMYRKYSVELTEGIAKARFNIRGTKDGLNMVRLELDKLAGKVCHRSYEFNKPGVAKLLLSDKGDNVIKNVETAERCIIESQNNPQGHTRDGNKSYDDNHEQPEVKMTGTISSGRKLYICQGDITELDVNAIVNAANSKLAHIGGLAKTVLDKGGPTIKEECDDIIKRDTELLVGDVAVTKAGNLRCKWVIHAVGPTWSGGQQNEEELLREAVIKSIEEASQQRIKSLAFPALSTGIFKYPKEAATRVIIEAIRDAFNDIPDSTIEDIYACDKDPETVTDFIQAFEFHYRKVNLPRSTSGSQKPPAGGILMPAAKEVSEGAMTFTLGKVRLVLKRGNITEENVDCIVNCTNTDLNMERGAVSKAILRAGGKNLNSEIRQKDSDMARDGVITTSGGKLPAAHIVHVSVEFFNFNWKEIVQKCLKAVKRLRNIKCIAFPAIGTGAYENSPETMGKVMVEALEEYKGKHDVQEVRVVVFDQEMLEPFLYGVRNAATRRKTGKSLFDRAVGFLKEKLDPSITLHFFSDDSRCIEQAINRLEQHYAKNRLDKAIVDEALKTMNTEQVGAIERLRETFSVQVEYNSRIGRVRLQGLMNDVLQAIDAVYRIIRDVHRYVQAAEKAEMLAAYLQWTYIEQDSTINEYDKMSNQAIEEAYNAGESVVQITPAGGETTEINFDHMEQYLVSNPTDKLPVVRKNKIKGASFDPPTTWVHMDSDSEMVKVSPDSDEYEDIEQKFFKSAGEKRNIIEILRIQTKFLWQQYMAKKEQLDVQNPGTKNEQFLWHGTTDDAYPSIAKAGFNRSYCGKNDGIMHDITSLRILKKNTSHNTRIVNKMKRIVAFTDENNTVHREKSWGSGTQMPTGYRPETYPCIATAYGDGVYFAASASYAVQNTYSKPDKKGHKHVFLARVLTGVYTKGKQGLRVPPGRFVAQHVLFDSVVDDPDNPGMYIIFNDTQAYPDYLISFV